MLISFSWLKEHVALPESITAEELAERLKLSTVEVEGIIRSGQPLDNIVVGKVLSTEKHPNADKLQVCRVDVGRETLDIVCGGSNVKAGMLVVVAKNGSRVKWHGEGELVELAPTKIRGVESNGMICGADEVGIAERFPKKDEKEIVDLSALKVKPGTPLAEVVGGGDVVFEIDNKSLSNRPDLWGHYGLAREVAALTNKSAKVYATKAIKKGSGVELAVMVENQELCPRYMAVAMNGITVAPSPDWLKEKLTAVGIRSINNVVDVMNFVMLDLGQPLHAFDARYLPNNAIVVRSARNGEKITGLDEKDWKLSSDMLVIASNEKPVAIAGIMGGLESGVQADTTTIVIESANFNPVSIRKTSSKLGLRTDASARFEKGLDPNLCVFALEKAVEMIGNIIRSAKVVSKVVDKGNAVRREQIVHVPINFFEQKIGVRIASKEIVTTLTRLGFGVKEKSQQFVITVPTWRQKDVSRAEDLVEEVARLHGYDAIPSSLPAFAIIPPEKNALRELENAALEILVREEGFTEVYNYSFVSEKQIKQMGDTVDTYLTLNNPLSSEKPYLRRCLLLNMLENVVANSANRSEVKLVEIGKVFRKELSGMRSGTNSDELLPRQDTFLTAVYSRKKDVQPFGTMRQVVEAIEQLIAPGLMIKTAKETGIGRHPARQAELLYRGSSVGSVYELHPLIAKNFGLTERVGVLKLNLSALAENYSVGRAKYSSVSLYPEVRRDIAILVKKEVAYEQVEKAILSADNLLTAVELFDIYEGTNVGKGYKSLAMHLTFANPERTLASEEVDKAFEKIIESLKKKVQAEVRT